MYKIVYLGYSEKMLEELIKSDTFDILLVIGTKGRLSSKYFELINEYGIRYVEIENKIELMDNIHWIAEADLAIMRKFEFIIPEEVIKKNLIINFHGGDLKNNRGAHSVIWSILLQESKTCLSCYRLVGGIDEGELIDTYYVDILKNDNAFVINEKLEKGIPHLLDSLSQYLSGEKSTQLITGGKYRRKIQRQDYVIDLYNDAIDLIRAKILSQQTYEGAIVIIDGIEYRIKRYEIFSDKQHGQRKVIVHEKFIEVCDNGENLHIYF